MAVGVVVVVLENSRMKIQALDLVVLVVLVLTQLEETEEVLTIVIPEMVAQRMMVVLVLLEALLVR